MKVLAEAAGVELVRVPRLRVAGVATATPYVIREQADHAVLFASSSQRMAREQFSHEVFVRRIGQSQHEGGA